MKTIVLRTSRRQEFINITSQVRSLVAESGLQNGWLCLYSPHTTAGLTVNEQADPDVVSDMLSKLERMVPEREGYAHSEGNSDAHIKTALVGVSQTIPVEGGKLRLGTWQGIFFCEFDGPRSREVWVTLMPAQG